LSLHLTSLLPEKEIIISLMPIVLDRARAPHLDYFLQVSLLEHRPHHTASLIALPLHGWQFLEIASQTVITLDQWDSFLQFNDSVDVALSQYNDDAACRPLPCSSLI
jgi:hypothetical protein